MKTIEEYTDDELSEKIEAIKEEREKTENALKRYEEELERRKQETSFGIPDVGDWCVSPCNSVLSTETLNGWTQSLLYDALNLFPSKESAEKHAEMLLAWRKALVANAKGEQIDIEVLLPLMKKGWIAMDDDKRWWWYEDKPSMVRRRWITKGKFEKLSSFNLKPAENWEDSLMECGL